MLKNKDKPYYKKIILGDFSGMKMAMGVAYEGTKYAGWQLQVNSVTVQHVIEQALEKIALHPIRITCAGRTDQGVHAKGQVFHFETDKQRSEITWLRACNYYLPPDVRILWVKEVSQEFHARFSAQARSYQYLMYQGDLPWFRNYALRYTANLNLDSMTQAAQILIGKHDFKGFRASRCQARSSIRTLTQLEIHPNKNWLLFNLTANAFLHHMVRNIVGVLIEVGQEKRSIDSVRQLLLTGDRRQAAPPAASHGLYLTKVTYPKLFGLPLNETNDCLITS